MNSYRCGSERGEELDTGGSVSDDILPNGAIVALGLLFRNRSCDNNLLEILRLVGKNGTWWHFREGTDFLIGNKNGGIRSLSSSAHRSIAVSEMAGVGRGTMLLDGTSDVPV